jgi:outer membrane protein TolC
MRARLLCFGVASVFASQIPLNASVSAAQSAKAPIQLPSRNTAKPVDNPPGQAIKLGLRDAIFIALRDNQTIRSAYADRVAQKFNLRVTEDTLNPHFALSSNPQYQTNNPGGNFLAADITPNATVLLPTGATVGAAWANQVTDSAGIQTRSSAAQISFTQPLLRGGGVDVTMAPVRTARLGETINHLNLKQIVSQMIGQVITSHRALLQAQEELKLAQASLARSQDLVNLNHALINAGRMAPVEIVQSEMDVENQRIQLLQAKKGVDDARLELLSLLGVGLGTAVVADESVEPTRIKLDFPALMKIAFEQRPDYAMALLVVEQNKLGIAVAQNQRLWDLSVFANGTYGRQTVTGLPGSQPVSDTAVGLSLNIPLNGLQRDQPYVQATTTLKTSQLQLALICQTVEMQVRSSIAGVDIAWQQLQGAGRAQQLAQRAVEIEKEKLKAGRSSNLQVRSLESDLRSAEETKLSAIITYLNAQTALDLNLGTTLKTWRISLRD